MWGGQLISRCHVSNWVASFHITLSCSTLGHFQFSLTNCHCDSHFGKLQAVLSKETNLKIGWGLCIVAFMGKTICFPLCECELHPWSSGQSLFFQLCRYGSEGTERGTSSAWGFILLVFILIDPGMLGPELLDISLYPFSSVKWDHSCVSVTD